VEEAILFAEQLLPAWIMRSIGQAFAIEITIFATGTSSKALNVNV
jgi:hypothetical protein